MQWSAKLDALADNLVLLQFDNRGYDLDLRPRQYKSRWRRSLPPSLLPRIENAHCGTVRRLQESRFRARLSRARFLELRCSHPLMQIRRSRGNDQAAPSIVAR